jgi:hypothetical protein
MRFTTLILPAALLVAVNATNLRGEDADAKQDTECCPAGCKSAICVPPFASWTPPAVSPTVH